MIGNILLDDYANRRFVSLSSAPNPAVASNDVSSVRVSGS